jgi:NAD(P)-dependent dehydrogenase (short-subunit alcohol dehydrogenase family)
MGELTGKVAIVTGAAQGIGEKVATFLAEDGAAVVLADIQHERVVETARGLKGRGYNAVAMHLDISNPAMATQVAQRTNSEFGAIDILINSAGLDAPSGAAWEIDEEHWRRVIDVNLSGQWWCSKAVLPFMIEQRGGRIVFISSIAARIGRKNTSVAYNATKAGLVGLTIALATHLEPFGILVNAIAPGPTGTGTRNRDENDPRFRDEVPLGYGGAEPVAHACRYLARTSGDWISGAVLNVSGGVWKG